MGLSRRSGWAGLAKPSPPVQGHLGGTVLRSLKGQFDTIAHRTI